MSDIETVKSAFHRWFFLQDDSVIDLVLGSVVANRFQDEPIWLLLVAPPSHMKTELLLPLAELPDTFLLSKMTPKTLLSGQKDPKSSLLFRLQEKKRNLLILKDFTTVLAMEREGRGEIFSQLREIADGYLTYSTGGGAGDLEWRGHMGLLAGVTDVIDQHDSVQNALGSRFLYYRLEAPDPRLVARAAERNVGLRGAWREDTSRTVAEFFSGFNTIKPEEIEISEEHRHRLIELAHFTSRMRTDVSRDGYQRIVLNIPQPEGPARLVRQFSCLVRGIAAVRGKKKVDATDIRVIERIARGTVSRRRMKTLKILYGKTPLERPTTRTVALDINFPVNSTREILEDLSLLNLVERTIEDAGHEEEDTYHGRDTRAYLWRLTDEFRSELDYLGFFPRPVEVPAEQEELTL